jgi:hypothetical protein
VSDKVVLTRLTLKYHVLDIGLSQNSGVLFIDRQLSSRCYDCLKSLEVHKLDIIMII